MKKSAKDSIREDRIQDEAVVDAHGTVERVMGWHSYLDSKICFPFRARCVAVKAGSPLKKGEAGEVCSLASEDACSSGMLVLVLWRGRKMAVPLSQLVAIDPDKSTEEAISDWHYWVVQGYLF